MYSSPKPIAAKYAELVKRLKYRFEMHFYENCVFTQKFKFRFTKGKNIKTVDSMKTCSLKDLMSSGVQLQIRSILDIRKYHKPVRKDADIFAFNGVSE